MVRCRRRSLSGHERAPGHQRRVPGGQESLAGIQGRVPGGQKDPFEARGEPHKGLEIALKIQGRDLWVRK